MKQVTKKELINKLDKVTKQAKLNPDSKLINRKNNLNYNLLLLSLKA